MAEWQNEIENGEIENGEAHGIKYLKACSNSGRLRSVYSLYMSRENTSISVCQSTGWSELFPHLTRLVFGFFSCDTRELVFWHTQVRAFHLRLSYCLTIIYAKIRKIRSLNSCNSPKSWPGWALNTVTRLKIADGMSRKQSDQDIHCLQFDLGALYAQIKLSLWWKCLRFSPP